MSSCSAALSPVAQRATLLIVTSLGICPALLAAAAVVQSMRIGVRHGDWAPLGIGAGLVVSAALLYLLHSQLSTGE